jgi:hypothetical protein
MVAATSRKSVPMVLVRGTAEMLFMLFSASTTCPSLLSFSACGEGRGIFRSCVLLLL